jgi:protein-tyrosine phosphatase
MSLSSALRRRLVQAKDALDGKLHPWRRARAAARLRDLEPSSALFICLGNVCRSPFGERALARRGTGLRVESAGFILPGRPPPDDALTVARGRGVEHADHVSRTVTPEMLTAADAVFVFDRFNVKRLRAAPGVRMDRVFWVGDFDPEWAGKRAVVDPWGKGSVEFERIFLRIERCVDEVAASLAKEATR